MIISNLHSTDQVKITNTIHNIDSDVASGNNTIATSNQPKDEYPKETTTTNRKYIDFTINTFCNKILARYLSENKQY